MQGFDLSAVPPISAGAGRLGGLGADLVRLAGPAAPVLAVVDPALIRLGLAEPALAALRTAGHGVRVFSEMPGEPTEAAVAAGVAAAREHEARAVVALGGGSALDAGKLVAALAGEGNAPPSYRLAAADMPPRHLALVAAPTTAGTGSEVTAVAVAAAPDGTKYWYWSPALKPDLVILDPVPAAGLPPAVTASTGLDALVHAIEAATNRRANPGSDVAALAGIRLVVEALPRAVAVPDDLGARLAMLHAATLAGIAIDTAGTALAHCVGHALGSLCGVPHGRAVALGMAATLPFVVEGAPTAFDRVAAAMGVDGAVAVPGAFAALMERVGCDRSLPPGLEAGALAERMAAPENAAMLRATARHVGDDDIQALARMVVGFPERAAA